MIKTEDPTIFILEQSEDRVVYQSVYGEQWEITGKCNACGQCEQGAYDVYYENVSDQDEKTTASTEPKRYQIWTGVPVGQSGACLDSRFGKRLDIPIRPELTEKMDQCVLSGKYLNGN